MKAIKVIFLFIFFLVISACSSGGGDAPTDSPGTVVDSGVNVFDITSSVSTTTAGVVQGFVITARDDQNNVLTSYTGTINLTTSDPNAELSWSTITYNAGMAGVANVNIKFKTAGPHDIQVSESTFVNAASGIMSGFNVTSAPLKNFVLTTLSSTVAGQAQTLTVTAVDEFSNVVSNYLGSTQISSTDSAGVYPTSMTFIPTDLGIKTFTYNLYTAGPRIITVVDGSISGSSTNTNTISVIPASPSQLVLENIPSTAGAGVLQNSQATLKDTYNNIATNYIGNFTISSSDSGAILPSSINFTLIGAGIALFSYDLHTMGNQTITVSNLSLGLSQTSANILVSVGAPSSTLSTLIISPTSGPADNITTATITVNIKDAYNNNISGIPVTLTSASSGVTLTQPASNTNTSGIAIGTIKSSQNGLKTISISSPTGLSSVSGNITYSAPVLTAPQNLVLTGRGSETVSPVISWSAPSQTGMGISYYEVAIGTTSGAQNTLAWKTIPGGSSINSYTIQNAVDTFSLSLAFDTTYYLSLRAVDQSSVVSSAVTSSWVITWTPRAFGSSLKFWFDGADASTITLDGSSRVSQWRDKSANTFVLNQATATDRPSSVNFLNSKGLVFDTVSKRLASTTAATFLDTDGFSAFFVQQTAAVGNWRVLLSTYSNKNFMLFSTYSGTAYRFFNGAHSSTGLQSTNTQVTGYIAVPSGTFTDRRDGTQVSSVSIAATTHATNNFAIGNYYLTNQTGTGVSTIGEVVVLETGSNLSSWEKIEGYLAHKWGLQANLPTGHPYKSVAP